MSQSIGFVVQRWIFFTMFALSTVYALYQLSVMIYRFGFQTNLRMLVYLCTIAFVVVTMIFPVGTRMTTAGSFFTYLTLLLAFLTYLALLCAWNRFVVSFYPSYFGAIFKPLSVALGGYASVVCFMGIVGAFDFPNVDVLNEFLTMVLIFTLPIIFTAKAVALTIYARRCFRSIPRDLKPRSIFLAVIKLSAVILVTQMGWLLVPLTAVLFACRTFLISPGVFLAFAVVYNLAVLFTFCVICWFLTVHDSIPSLLALLSEGIAKQRMSVYLYTPNGLATQLGESDGSQPPSSPLLSSIPWRASLRIPGLMRDGSLAGGTHGSPLSTVGPAPSAGHRSTTLSGLGTGSSADQRRTNGWDRRSLRSSALVSTHRSRHIERTVRQMSKHSMFRSVSSATRPGATSPRSPQVLPCSTPDSGISLKPDCEPNHGAATFPPRRYRIGRFRWERESERFQQLYRTMRQWGYTVSSSSGASYRDRPVSPQIGASQPAGRSEVYHTPSLSIASSAAPTGVSTEPAFRNSKCPSLHPPSSRMPSRPPSSRHSSRLSVLPRAVHKHRSQTSFSIKSIRSTLTGTPYRRSRSNSQVSLHHLLNEDATSYSLPSIEHLPELYLSPALSPSQRNVLNLTVDVPPVPYTPGSGARAGLGVDESMGKLDSNRGLI